MRALLILLALLSTAQAQETPIPPCAPHDEMAATLLTRAKEHPVGIGITEDRRLVEIYASEFGTWTITDTDMTTGESCIKVFGSNFHIRPVPPREQGAILK